MKTTPFFLILSIVLFLLPIKKVTTPTALNATTLENKITKNIQITDSLFIGEPLAKNAEFIRNLEQFTNANHFRKFDNILKKHNKKFVHYKSNTFIKTLKVSDKLTIELKRRAYNVEEKNANIQVVLYTKINNAIKDSITFYKYQLDKDFPKEQRFETLVFLSNDLEIFKLESYCSLSEFSFQADKWEKFKINSSNGKIEFIKKLNYKEDTNQIEAATAQTAPITAVAIENEEFPFISNLSWSNNCATNNYVVFSVVGGQFRFSKNFAMNTELKKIADNEWNVLYRHPIIRPIPENMLDCADYSTHKAIAKIKYVDDKIEFTWLGFYNNITKKIMHKTNPFTQKEETEPVILQKCHQ